MSKIMKVIQLVVLISLLGAVFLFIQNQPVENFNSVEQVIVLPDPETTGNLSVEEAINKRRSIRNFQEKPLTLKELAQLLWAAQGITDKKNDLRTVPSAGAIYPLEIYIVIGEDGVNGLTSGFYHFNPIRNELDYIRKGDMRLNLSNTAYGQESIKKAPVTIIITGVYSRTQNRYGDRGIQYVHMEAGHSGQNLYLQAEALELGTVVIGSFSNEDVQTVLKLPNDHTPLYLVPVGHPAN
ncbi:MAG: SagB/ThcOx family dehydrogenase [Methanobacteriaceae archaeon]|nr:SagB/ThcOx family dehydrogenase [Methanobacteriaceae archaeon]